MDNLTILAKPPEPEASTEQRQRQHPRLVLEASCAAERDTQVYGLSMGCP